jgi:hypothetical protein
VSGGWPNAVNAKDGSGRGVAGYGLVAWNNPLPIMWKPIMQVTFERTSTRAERNISCPTFEGMATSTSLTPHVKAITIIMPMYLKHNFVSQEDILYEVKQKRQTR